MFERFFGPKSEEQMEESLFKTASGELDTGVNGPAMYRAFDAVREENQRKGYGFTNNHLLMIVKL